MHARRLRNLALAFLVLGAVGHLALSTEGLPRTVRLRDEADRLRAANAALRDENRRLGRELAALADDPRELERAAREELGLVKPGEVVFRLEDTR